MYFTQEDYKKIENWLSKKSVKDSDFQEALPLNGEEIITVVQSGHNKKVKIREFIDKIYKYNGSDFTNITNIYKVENITLGEAINFIPAVNRKKGQVITFLNTDGNWEIYQFVGELNQWNNLNFWNNPFDLGVLDYADLVNKPSINGKELNGNTSLKDLGIQPAGNYADKDTVTDVLNSITNINNNLSAINEDIDDINTDIGTINDSITSINHDIGTINGSITGINTDILDINTNLNTHINDVSKFETLFEKFFEYDERNNAIKAKLNFYTDIDKNLSAGGFNNNTGEIVVISSYSELKDKPYINGQELVSGDNSLDKLGIQPKGNYTTNEFVESLTSAIINKLNLHIKDFEDFVARLNTYFEFDSDHQAIKVLLDLYTVTGKNISAGGYNNSGTEIIVPKSYGELTEKPQINGQELLSGNNTLDKLGIQPKGNYATNEIVESQISAIIEKLNSHINDFETFVNELNTFVNELNTCFQFEPDKQAVKVLYDLYTDKGKNISASGYNNSGTEIIIPKSYTELTDKPQINGQELLSGDNSLDKLGIQPKGNYTTNEFVEGLVGAVVEKLNLHITDFENFVNQLNTYFEFDSQHKAIKVLYDLYTDTGKNISAGGYNNSGTEIIVPTSYPELTDKPKINGIELVGNLTSKDLGLQLEGDYLTISDILNTVKQEDGTTKQYVKPELLPEVKGGNGIEILQTLSKTNISLLVDTNTFSFGENNELQINKIDGGIF